MTSLFYILIPTYFMRKESLFKLLVILTPFTSTSIFNTSGGFWIQPSLLILLFIFIKYYLLSKDSFEKRVLPVLLIVLATVSLSNILVFFNESIFIDSTILNKLNLFVSPSYRHLTFILYLFIGFLFSLILSNHFKASPNKLLDAYLISLYSNLPVSIFSSPSSNISHSST